MLLTACVTVRQDATDRTDDFLSLMNVSSSSIAVSAQSSSTATSQSTSSVPVAESGTTLDRGSPDAPLELLVFTNYSCAFCRQFEEAIVPRLMEDFVKKGNLLLRTAILPIRKYPLSVTETAALFCAREQGRGDGFHQTLFALPAHTLPALLDAAGELGMDTQKLNACLSSAPALAFAAAQGDLAESLDVTLVPTLILNGDKQTGLPRYADLRGWIESVMR